MRWGWLVVLCCSCAFAQSNLVPNGDFERDESRDSVPDFWMVAGTPHVKQRLAREIGRNEKGFFKQVSRRHRRSKEMLLPMSVPKFSST